MNEINPPSKPAPLDYARPQARRGNLALGVVVGILGACAGLFGGFLLFIAIQGFIFVYTESSSSDFAGDLFGVIMCMLIGVVCLYAALRWCSAVRGIISGG